MQIMKYVIYEPAIKAEIRHQQITDDARYANFLPEGMIYDDIIYHPTDDKAAIIIVKLEPIYYQDMPTQGYNFEIFFTRQESARSITTLSSDWIKEII